MIVLFDKNETRGSNYRSLLLNTVRAPSIESSLPLFLSTPHFSLLTLDQYTCLNSFILGLAIARPDGLVKMFVLPYSQSLTARRHVISTPLIIGCTLQILVEVVQNLAIFSCTNHRGHSLEASHLFLIRSDHIQDVVILSANIEQVRQALSCILSSG